MSRREIPAGDVALWCGWITAAAVTETLLTWVGASDVLAAQTAVVFGVAGWVLVAIIERWRELHDEPAEQPEEAPERERWNRRRTVNWQMAVAMAITMAAGPYRGHTWGRIALWLALCVTAGILLAAADERRRARR